MFSEDCMAPSQRTDRLCRESASVWYYESQWHIGIGLEWNGLSLSACYIDIMATPSSTYTQAEAKGRLLFQKLQQRLRDSAAYDVVQANLEINYSLGAWECPPSHSTDVENAFLNENIELEGWRLVSVNDRTSSETIYTNFFCPGQGSIFCAENDKMKDHNHPQDRLQWSEVLFQVHHSEAVKALQSAKLLRTMWRFWIVNPDTNVILGEAKSFGSPHNEGLPYTEYRQGDGESDSGFFALLGCPNGSGIVRMLIDHCTALGHKTITSVRVLNSSGSISPPTLYFVLADCDVITPGNKSKRSRAGQKRDAKRHQKNHPGQAQGPVSSGNA